MRYFEKKLSERNKNFGIKIKINLIFFGLISFFLMVHFIAYAIT